LARKGQEVQALANGILDIPTQRAIRALERAINDQTEALDERVSVVESGVSSVTAGSAMVTCVPTTGDVVVNVVPANLNGIPESGVVNLVSDLASKLSSTRNINTTAPLAGGGDLTADRTLSLNDNGITDAKLRDSAALSVIGRASNSSGDPADISASADGDVLRRSGTALGFGAIPESSVTNLVSDLAAKLPAANVSGTSGTLAKFTGTSSLGNSIVTESGSTITVTGTLTVTGNTNLGNDSADLTTGLGRITFTDTPTAATTNRSAVFGENSGTYDATAAGRIARGLHGSAIATRSAGANNLRNVAVWADAANAQLNDAIYTDRGDVLLNQGGGVFSCAGAATFTSSLTINGNTTIGDSGSDAHTLNGTLNANGTSGGSNEVLQIISGVPKWSSVSTAGAALGAGANNFIAKWTSATTLAASIINEQSSGTVLDLPYTAGVQAISNTTGSVGFSVQTFPTASTLTIQEAFRSVLGGTYNTTAAVANVYGAKISATATRSSGANNLVNTGLYCDASGGQVNRALLTDHGDVILNDNSGTTTIKGATTITTTLAVNGNATLGDASGDQHTLNGNITASNTPTAGWMKYGSLNGRIKIGQQRLTSSSGTYTPATGAKAVLVRMVGGGGGGGSKFVSSVTCFGGGGASGAYFEQWFDAASDVTGGTYHVGAAGTAGSNSTGGDGGDTDIVINGTTYTAKGGKGGTGNRHDTSPAAGGAKAASGTSAGDFSFQEEGQFGAYISSTVSFVVGGAGGSSPFGAGGGQVLVAGGGTATGKAATGFGGGGGGMADNTGSSTVNAGAGTAGLIIVEEFA